MQASEDWTRRRPASLWIGPKLSFLEVLCLSSFVSAGMRPVLYCYEEVKNIPAGVEVLDAEPILSKDRFFINLARNSPAPFADVFRYHMLAKTDFYWIDTDIYAFKPFEFMSDCIFGLDPPMITNAILGLPKGSAALQYLLDWTAQPNLSHPYMRRRFLENLKPLADDDGNVPIEHLPYKAIGPIALTDALNLTGLSAFAFPEEHFFPIRPRHVLSPYRRLMKRADFSKSVSVHLYSSVVYKHFRSEEGVMLDENSYLGRLLHDDGIDPKAFPIT